MKLGVWLAFLDSKNGNPSRKGGKTIDLYCYIKILKVKPVYQQMTLSPKLGVVGISTLRHFRLPLPIQMFIKVASSPRLSGIGMPSPILWSHLLKMQRIVLLSSLLWWELGTNSLIIGPGEWLSFWRFTSKLSWSWSWSLIETVFKAYHDDLGHQDRDRTTSLILRRFFWPGMNQDIKNRVQMCGRCIRRKTAPTRATELVSITSTAPMELVCIDFLSLEKSKGGQENILVITDHFSRYAQAIPTRNQKASTTAKVLYENFFLHYGFPAVLHSDKGANFESNVIWKLCEIAGVKKSRTTPYHPVGNGMVERYNETLLNMLGTLPEDQKTDWKSYISTLTHAYNAAEHDSTGYAPFFLMFGRHPRLANDAFLGLN